MNSEVARFVELLTEEDFRISATTLMVKDYLKALRLIDKQGIDRIIDLGCGFGGITKAVGDFFTATEVYGVDIAQERAEVARSRGIQAVVADLEVDELPFQSDYFDLVISNGVIEHLRFYDNLIVESYRLLKKGGCLLIVLPNLASYIQRISLLLGYQPSDVNISKEIYVGTIFHAGKEGMGRRGHVHSATIGAMKQLLRYYNFSIVAVRRGDPKIAGAYAKWAPLFKLIGYFFPASWARRIIIIARK